MQRQMSSNKQNSTVGRGKEENVSCINKHLSIYFIFFWEKLYGRSISIYFLEKKNCILSINNFSFRNMAGASLQQALLLTGGQLENLSVESNQSAPRKFEPSQSEARVVRGEFQRQNSTPGATSSSHQFTRQISNVSQQLALAGGGGGGSPDLDFRNRAGGPERNSHKPNYRNECRKKCKKKSKEIQKMHSGTRT